MTATAWLVYCEAHRHYLRRASVGGTSWVDDVTEARHYPTKPQAREAAKLATWLEHRPIVWAVADESAEL